SMAAIGGGGARHRKPGCRHPPESASGECCAAQERPATGSNTPCTARAASEARKQSTLARSAGATHLLKSAEGMSARLRGVSMMLGSTALTLMPLPFNSSDRLSVSFITTLFEAQYAPILA